MNKDNILEIEIDLTGYCNLKCPKCSRNYTHSRHMVSKNIRPLSEIIRDLDGFKNLRRIMLAGQVSEPTLYPDLIGFLKYLKSRNIWVDLYTNASLPREDLFRKIGEVLDYNDRVNFTICGSTQELHERYRIGSKLSVILKNAKALRRENPIDYCQYIRFQYNKDDCQKAQFLQMGFTYYYVVDSEGDRLENESTIEIKDKPIKDALIKNIIRKVLKSREKTPLELCSSYMNKKCYIDQFGEVFLCPQLKEYHKDSELNYQKVLDKKYNCCKLCSEQCRRLMNAAGVDYLC